MRNIRKSLVRSSYEYPPHYYICHLLKRFGDGNDYSFFNTPFNK